MSLSQPQNRQEFREYIKYKLGAPVLQVNVAEEQIDVAIDDAFQFFNERNHFNGVERGYLVFNIDDDFKNSFEEFEYDEIDGKEYKKQQNYLQLPDDVVGVVQIMNSQTTSIGGGIVPGGMIYPILLGSLTGDSCGSVNSALTSYYAIQEYLALINWMFFPPKSFSFNQRTHRLIVDGNLNRMRGGMMVIECMIKPSPDIYPDLWNDLWLKEYAVELVRLQWGQNLSKYNQLGVRIDNVETEIDTARTNIYTALGVAEAAQNLGTFTGSTIADNVGVKVAAQSLETAVELRATAADSQLTGTTEAKGVLNVGNDGLNSGYYVKFQRNGNTQFDFLARNIPSGGTLNINNSNGNNAKVVVYSEEFWVRNLGGNNGNGKAKFDGEVTFVDSFLLDGTKVTASGAELNILDGVTADATELNLLDGVTATTAELNYVDGVTSNIQTQLDAIQSDVDQNEADADTAIALKANIASPTFTGTPAAPTAASGTNTTQLATTAFVTGAVNDLVNGAPGALDTLNELAAALNDDANAATNLTTLINANTNDISDIRSVSGTVDGSTHLGTFSGSTITDNVAIKTALQELETAQEATQADVDQNEADADAAIAAVLAGTSIPGPYNNDAAAATGGVAVGAIYKNTNGTIHWRVA